MRLAASILVATVGFAASAGAAQIDVRNCAGAKAEMQAFEITDILKAIPFSTLTLFPRTSGLIGCQGDLCYVRIQIANSSTTVPYAKDIICLTTTEQDGVTLIRTDRWCLC